MNVIASVVGRGTRGPSDAVDPGNARLLGAITRGFGPDGERLADIERVTRAAFRSADYPARGSARRSRTTIRAGGSARRWFALGAATMLGLVVLAQTGAGQPGARAPTPGYHDAASRSLLPDRDVARPASCQAGGVSRPLPGVSSEEGRDPDQVRHPRVCPTDRPSPHQLPGDPPP
jgi:hypothetical protein